MDLSEIGSDGVNGFSWLTMEGFCEHGNEPSGRIIKGYFLFSCVATRPCTMEFIKFHMYMHQNGCHKNDYIYTYTYICIEQVGFDYQQRQKG
jgi:hypothetical protein